MAGLFPLCCGVRTVDIVYAPVAPASPPRGATYQRPADLDKEITLVFSRIIAEQEAPNTAAPDMSALANRVLNVIQCDATSPHFRLKTSIMAEISDASDVFGRIKAALEKCLAESTLEEDRFDRIVMTRIPRAYVENNHVESAKAIIRMIAQSHTKDIALQDTISTLIKKGNFEAARALISELSHEEDKISQLVAIAIELALKEDVEDALALLRTPADPIDQEAAFRKWIKDLIDPLVAIVEKGERKKAEAILRKIPDSLDKAEALEMMALNLEGKGNFLEAEIFIMLNPSLRKKNTLLKYLISKILNTTGNCSEAQRIADLISDDKIKDSAYRQIALKLAKMGLSDEAITLALARPQNAPFFFKLADIFIEKNQLDKAQSLVLRCEARAQALILEKIRLARAHS